MKFNIVSAKPEPDTETIDIWLEHDDDNIEVYCQKRGCMARVVARAICHNNWVDVIPITNDLVR